MAKPKFKLDKGKILAAGGVLLLIAAAVGIGFLARMLQTQSTPTGNQQDIASTTLPQLVSEVQDLNSAGKTEEANKKIQDGLSDPGTSDDIKYMLYIQQGNAKFNTQDYLGAIDDFKKALAIKETFEITKLIGEAYEFAGNIPEAIVYYKRAYPLVPASSPLAEGEREVLRMKLEALGGSL